MRFFTSFLCSFSIVTLFLCCNGLQQQHRNIKGGSGSFGNCSTMSPCSVLPVLSTHAAGKLRHTTMADTRVVHTAQVASGIRKGALGMLTMLLKKYPYVSSFVVTGVKAAMADALVQIGAPDKFSILRNLAFLLYGGLYQGCTQYFIYNELFPKFLGVSSDPTTVLKKVLLDLLVLTPFLCLPVVYVFKALVFKWKLSEAFHKYMVDVKENGIVFKYWMLWGPMQCLTFGIIPKHLRIGFIATVSFFWTIILSSVTSKTDGVKSHKKD